MLQGSGNNNPCGVIGVQIREFPRQAVSKHAKLVDRQPYCPSMPKIYNRSSLESNLFH